MYQQGNGILAGLPSSERSNLATFSRLYPPCARFALAFQAQKLHLSDCPGQDHSSNVSSVTLIALLNSLASLASLSLNLFRSEPPASSTHNAGTATTSLFKCRAAAVSLIASSARSKPV